MTVLRKDPTRVSVALTGEDMARLGITYDGMDLTAAFTRRAILTVFDEACRSAGVAPRLDGGLVIETLPGCRSGCIFVFSARQKRKEGFFCRIGEADAFLDCVSLLRDETIPAEAYLYDGMYYICFTDASGCAVLSEYGNIAADESGLALAHLAEFGERLNIG